jgi:menaquinone-9 beta-reductase
MPEKRIMIVGGGLSGLVAAIHLARNGITSTVIERQQYPFHRVCGEYISNEVVPYLNSLDAFPAVLSPSHITRFQLTSTRGVSTELPLDLGGFGISRFALDHFLFQLASKLGVRFELNTEVISLTFKDDQFNVETTGESYGADVVIGCYGKRSRLDKQLNRSFIHRYSPYVGVKYHVRLPSYPDDLITLHNFSNGYCGISRVEGDIINVCYLTHRDQLRAHGNIRAMEEAVLFRNPFIRDIFEQAEFLFDRPETINEISFETKGPIDNHILMGGDAAGMITPLCGNGMAIAIHSAKLISEHILRYTREANYSRDQLERDYAAAWANQFAARLWTGRNIQRLFGHDWASNFAVQLARHVKPAAAFLMKKTHGNPF